MITKIKICYLLLALVMCACSKISLEEINNLNGNKISIIGHGGSGFPSSDNHLPINSATSVLKAIEGFGADGVEIDVQMSEDSVLFMYHDLQLSSMTNCHGCLHESTADQLLNCRYRTGIANNFFTKEYLSPLENVIARFAKRKIAPIVLLDVKTFVECPLTIERKIFLETMARRLFQLIDEHDAKDWIIIDTNNWTLIRHLKSLDWQIKIIFAGRLDAEFLQMATEYDLYGQSFNNDEVSGLDIQRAHEQGLRTTIWGVRIRSAAIEAIKKNPDFIETDNIILLQEILQ